MMKKIIKTLILCAAVWFAGCASSLPTHFYMLNPVAAPGTAPQANYSVSVGPVSVPALLDRQQIVTRTGPNQVFIDEYERWASPLKENIGRVIVQDLVSLLGTSQVTMFPESTAAGASYRAIIDVMRFDSELGKSATLDVCWTVSSAKNGQSHRGRTQLTEPAQGSGYPALVAAQSRALGQLSADIAGAIRKMEVRQP
ncbi:MAG: PqiC family protein [Syntrophaceae bacterium]